MSADLGTYAKQVSGGSSDHSLDPSFPVSAQPASPPQALGKPVVLSCTPEPSNFRARAAVGGLVTVTGAGEDKPQGGWQQVRHRLFEGNCGASSSSSDDARGTACEGGGGGRWIARDDGQFMPIAQNSARRTSVSVMRVPSAGAVQEIQFLVHDGALISRCDEGAAGVFDPPEGAYELQQKHGGVRGGGGRRTDR